jgi:agmatine/peptidylarginine deiminase
VIAIGVLQEKNKYNKSITVMANPVIYTSEQLRTEPNTACVAEAISDTLVHLHIEHKELKNINNYWCRDYMPISIDNNGTYARYKYYPDYLVNFKKYQKDVIDQRDACKDINLFASADMNIVFDGGNYVRCGNKVIMTDKIFCENPLWKPIDLLQHLSEVLQADIILLPWDMKELFGHADGMVAFIGGNKILLNSCWKNRYKKFHCRLMKTLEAHFEVIELSYNCKEDRDSWCYLNYLQVPGGILLPCLSKECDCENDVAAIETFRKLFPGMDIFPIFAKPLIEYGGAIHCVTWEYYRS